MNGRIEEKRIRSKASNIGNRERTTARYRFQADMLHESTGSWRHMRHIEILLLLSAAATKLVSARIQTPYLSRFLDEKGADEDDDSDPVDDAPTQTKPWYYVENYVVKDSLAYDMVEGFGYVATCLIIVMILWTCLVYCGICPDHRLDRRRDLRRVKDGRGVFSPLGQAEDASDDDSEESAEFGHSRENDPFGDIRSSAADQELEEAAKKFFSKGEDRQQKKKKIKAAPRNKFLEIELSEEFAVKTVLV